MKDNCTAETGMRLQNNPWGYQVNINHPQVRPFYERYQRWKGIPSDSPMSDAERFEFEKYYMDSVEKQEKRKAARGKVIDLADFETPDCKLCTDQTKYVTGKTFDIEGPGQVGKIYECQNQQCRKVRKEKNLYLMRSMENAE